VWIAVMFSTGWNASTITATAPELAAKAQVNEAGARRALSYLTRLGILRRVARGRYEVSPHACWQGDLSARARAADRWGMSPDIARSSENPAGLPVS
jgi:predicted transcriptional regulator of viral defense system